MARRKRKNYLPTLLLLLILWTLFLFLVFFIEPEMIKNFPVPNLYLPFFLLLFVCLFFTFAVLFINTRRGLIVSMGIVFFLILRVFDLGNILNAILIAGFIISLEYYFTRGN
jgi:hypothetical protein